MNQHTESKRSIFSLRRNWPWLLTLGMAIALLVLVFFSRSWQVRKLVSHFEAELQTASEPNIPSLIDQIAEFGDEGIPAIVKALGSEREVVSQLARRKLSELFSQWEHLPPDRATLKIYILAESLANHIDHFGPTAKSVATDYAERILLIRTDERVASRMKLINHCDTVLRNPSQQNTVPIRVARRSSIPLGQNGNLQKSNQKKQIQSLGPLPELPGGGIPIEPIKTPAKLSKAPQLSQPNLITTPGTARSITNNKNNLDKEPNRFNPRISRPKRITSDIDQKRIPSRYQNKNQNSQDQSSSDQQLQSLFTDGKPIPYAKLITQSQSTDRKEAFAAADQLQQLGFDRYRLAIGWEMRHSNPKMQMTLLSLATDSTSMARHRLARTLSRSEGIKLWPWLIWLSMDANADVRREAIVQMGKITHLEVEQRLRKVAEFDADDSNKKLAKRILESRVK